MSGPKSLGSSRRAPSRGGTSRTNQPGKARAGRRKDLVKGVRWLQDLLKVISNTLAQYLHVSIRPSSARNAKFRERSCRLESAKITSLLLDPGTSKSTSEVFAVPTRHGPSTSLSTSPAAPSSTPALRLPCCHPIQQDMLGIRAASYGGMSPGGCRSC
ncbi:hypothetical protein GALMADRAFT_149087 [Galerina marginata CBS 339.88]|uniref:Uncharacterized protein n=1 Tax=Galerina marginata (strain CBS 339.88) TaxID=685588 RepID=A0A067SE24_GALM3|nr:hypothetical protein GALMADRAFT_149087 [Galerina marginata CBS 339.88]